MTRLLPQPGEGHRIRPRPPAHHNANPTVINTAILSVTCGLAYTVIKSITGKITPGTFLRSTAVSTGIVSILVCIEPTLENRLFVYPALRRDGITPSRRLWENNGKLGRDDCVLAGGALGVLAALRPRAFPGAVGWKRYVGAVTTGCFIGWYGGRVAFPDKKHLESVVAWTQQKRAAAELKMQLAHDRDFTAGRSNGERKAMQLLASTDLQRQGGGGVAMWSQQGMGSQHDMAAEQSMVLASAADDDDDGETLPPGTAPHTVAIMDGKLMFMPETDYLWSPSSAENGLRILREHISELQQERADLAKEAEYVWLELAKKEHAYYREENDDTREMQRRELNLLDSIHHNHWRRISAIDWMIANSKKNMRQIETVKANDGKVPWLPQPRALAGSVHSPELTLSCIRSHWEGTKHVISVLEEVASSPDTPEEARKRFNTDLEDVRVSLKATEALLKEFEGKVQEADRNSDDSNRSK